MIACESELEDQEHHEITYRRAAKVEAHYLLYHVNDPEYPVERL